MELEVEYCTETSTVEYVHAIGYEVNTPPLAEKELCPVCIVILFLIWLKHCNHSSCYKADDPRSVEYNRMMEILDN